MPPLPPARTMGTSPEGAGRAESLARARVAAVWAMSSTASALEDLEAFGAGQRLVPGLHAGVAVGDALDVEAGPDLVVGGEEPVGVRDEDPTAAVADADLDLGDGVAGGTGGVVGSREELELAGLVDAAGKGAIAAVVAGERAERDGAGRVARPRGRRRRRPGPRPGGRARRGRRCGQNPVVSPSTTRMPAPRERPEESSSIRRSSRTAPDVTASSAKTSAMSPPACRAVDRTRSSTSGSMRAVSVTAVS